MRVVQLELFFHVPILIATRLMQNQRFADARRWFHYVFDPTSTDGKDSERFWKIKPFYNEQLEGSVETLQVLLAEGSPEFDAQVREWTINPLQPHAIARLRISAYMQAIVQQYLDCLIGYGDVLFRRETREDAGEAALLYLLAGEILGTRPTLLPAQETAVSTPNLKLGRFSIVLNGLLGRDPIGSLVSMLAPGARGFSSARAVSGVDVGTTRRGSRFARHGDRGLGRRRAGAGRVEHRGHAAPV